MTWLKTLLDKRHIYFITTLVALAIIGTVLRCNYLRITAFDERGHDYDGHLQYIEYVKDHWTLPPIHEGKQYYHPPLYYFSAATVLSLAQSMHANPMYALQIFSLVLSIIALFICLWIAGILFPGKNQRVQLILFGSIVTVLPSFIFFAPRLNNDALYQVFAMLTYAFLLKFWLSRKTIYWVALTVTIALGLLTKSNILPFAPLAIIVVALTPKMSWKKKIACALGLTTVTLIVLGSLQLMRPSPPGKEALVGNYRMLTNFVENHPKNLFTFNPHQILKHPYNDPFGDEARRQMFWEYLYRSAFTGEFHFGDQRKLFVLGMLLSSLLLVPLILYSMVSDMRKGLESFVPLWSGLILFLLAHLAFRIFFPYSSSQDFRYSLPLMIPFAYYACSPALREHITLLTIRVCLCSIAILCAVAFLIGLE